jgi:mRNA interferase YafQ
MRKIQTHRNFDKDVARLVRAGYDVKPLKDLILLLEKGDKLPTKYKAHELKGEFKGIWDCHIKNNWLLLYIPDEVTVVLLRTGTHAEVLGL